MAEIDEKRRAELAAYYRRWRAAHPEAQRRIMLRRAVKLVFALSPEELRSILADK